MIYTLAEIVSDPPFLTLVWIVATFTATFIVILELLATFWVIAELRVRMHLLKMRRHQQERDEQLARARMHLTVASSQPPIRRRTSPLRYPDQRSH